MRGLLKASLLLAPALTSALVVPDVSFAQIEDMEDDRAIADHSFALIGVEVPKESPDHRDSQALAFRLDVFPSEEACGFGNVTVDGQILPQTVKGDVSSGKGSVTTDRKSIIGASWSFHCVKINGLPDSQFLKFVVDVVDGNSMQDVGFSALFRQTGSTEILNIETDLSLPDQIVANPNPEALQPVGDEEQEFAQLNIEDELQELYWMRAQLHELEYLIMAKERAIAEYSQAHLEVEIQDCDSLKCVANAVIAKAHEGAKKVMNGIHGHLGDHHGNHQEVGNDEVTHFPKPPFKKPQWWPGKPKHGKHGNHTSGPPKHGNHSHPPPHWKKPPHKLLPICRYPPPPGKGRPPHQPPPPHHGHHGEHPPPPPPHREFPEDDRFPPPPPPHHDEFPHDGPPHGHHGRPDHDDLESLREGHHGPPDDERPHDRPHNEPDHRPDFDHPPPPPPNFEAEAPFRLFDDGGAPPGQPPFSGPRRHGMSPAFHIIKYVVIGILLSLLVLALHRRACTPANRAERKARCEERRRRRAFRRAAQKHTMVRFFSRLSGINDEESDDYEEKRQAILASEAEDGMSTTMTEEITELRNAADVVDDMVAARTQSQPVAIPAPAPEARPLMRDYDIGSQVGDGEELPAYEDNDGSEMSSVVADGFRYTPGSTEYSPANSPPGSVSDVLGPDTKQ